MNQHSPLRTAPMALLCMVSVAACGQPNVHPSAETTTLRFERLADGNLQFCESNSSDESECSTLPYDGQCEVLEIEIDLTSGRACERCVDASGAASDRGCTDTYVACTMVTIPEPDCAVCAYVNGAVIFSTCIADEPQCRVDPDCHDGFGHQGRCLGGECIFPEGCMSDRDCRDDETCQIDRCAEAGCVVGQVCPPCYGRCVPEATGCEVVDCAPGYHCEMTDLCLADADPAGMRPACVPEPECVVDPKPDPCAIVLCPDGQRCELEQVQCIREPCPPIAVCVDIPRDPCDGLVCRDGQHCELEQVQCIQEPCPPLAVCVDDTTGCQSDSECAADQRCLMACSACTPGAECPPCRGYCVDQPDPPKDPCRRAGCSGQLCSADDVVSTCEWRPEYACFDHGVCETQADGTCGWTHTDKMRECLVNVDSTRN